LRSGNLAARSRIGKSTDLAKRRDKILKKTMPAMRYYEIAHRRKHKLRPTNLRVTRCTCKTTQANLAKRGNFGWWRCQNHATILLLLDAMRPLLALVAIVVSGSAQAQFPYNYAPYSPHNLPNGSQYGPPAQSRSPASMAQEMLGAHNAVRTRVGVPPLVWSDQLAQVAQDWASHLIATGALSHRPDNRYGENIYAIGGGHSTPADVVDSWAKEARGYDIRSSACSGVCGHYTQIVWAKTHAVGCAVARNLQREVWVCNYDPPGNVIGFRPY
jgi:pathogenesis-related protein 1